LLQAFLRAVLIFAQEIAGGPLGRIAFMKLAASIAHHKFREVGLPESICINLDAFGVHPIDFGRILSQDPVFKLTDDGVYIPVGLQAGILEQCEELLGGDKLDLIRSEVERRSRILGRGFGLSIPFIGCFKKEYRSLADLQLESFILSRSENILYWIFNPEWLRNEIAPNSTSLSMGTSFPTGPSLKWEKTMSSSEMEVTHRKLHRKVLFILRIKGEFLRTRQTWRLRIHRTALSKKFQNLDGVDVMYVGRCQLSDRGDFFVDTVYTTEGCDFIRMRVSEELKKQLPVNSSARMLVVGTLLREDDQYILFPYGFLRLN